jgi:hypothetical protein
MTSQTEKVRKLRALARSPNRHEAALALAKAQALEPSTAKAIAHAIARLLEARGLMVRVRRRSGDGGLDRGSMSPCSITAAEADTRITNSKS